MLKSENDELKYENERLMQDSDTELKNRIKKLKTKIKDQKQMINVLQAKLMASKYPDIVYDETTLTKLTYNGII